jgi:thiol-disulfide isomerase/thioredoxin
MIALLACSCISLGVSLWAEDEKKGDAPKVEIKAVSLTELDKQVAGWKGKPVAMDVWATWCVPCREKFPKFMALAAKHKDKASFFSLSIDEAEDIEKAKRFLESKKATFANFLAKEGPEAVEKKYEFEGVPQYVVWDASGKIAFKTDDVAKLEEKLKEMLPEKKKDA